MRGQEWIIQQMKNLGYKSNEEGVCFGTAHMAARATIARRFNQFEDRLKKLFELAEKKVDLSMELKRQQQERIDLISRVKQEEIKKIRDQQLAAKSQKEIKVFEDLNSEQRKAILNKISDKMMEYESKQEINLNDVLAFFDGIQVFFAPHDYPDLFPIEERKGLGQASGVTSFSKLILPNNLLEQKIPETDKFSDIYNQQELSDWFASLSRLFQEPPSCDYPIAFTLLNVNHAITIGYDPLKKDPWTLIDPNQLPPQPIADTNILAKSILSAFPLNKFVAMNTRIYTSGDHQHDLQKKLKIFRNTIQKALTPDQRDEKSKRQDFYNATWLMMASQIGDIESIKMLASSWHGLNLNDQESSFKYTALHFAAKHNHILKTLLSYGANPNIVSKFGTTPLTIATRGGDTDTVNVLLSYGANPDMVDDDGYFILAHAVSRGYTDIVNALLAYGAKPDMVDKHGNSILVYAKNTDIIKNLLLYRANPNDKKPVSRLYLAAQGKDIDIFKSLLTAKADVNAVFTASKSVLIDLAKKQNRQTEVTQLLSSLSEKIDNFGALDIAAFYGDKEMIKMLQQAGAQSQLSQDALINLAKCSGQDEIVELFQTKNSAILSGQEEKKESKSAPLTAEVIAMLCPKLENQDEQIIKDIKKATSLSEVQGILRREIIRIQRERTAHPTYIPEAKLSVFSKMYDNTYLEAIIDAFKKANNLHQKSNDIKEEKTPAITLVSPDYKLKFNKMHLLAREFIKNENLIEARNIYLDLNNMLKDDQNISKEERILLESLIKRQLDLINHKAEMKEHCLDVIRNPDKIIKLLDEKKIEFHPDDNTLLMAAVDNNRIDLIKKLLECKADPNKPDNKPFQKAIELNLKPIITLFLKKIDPASRFYDEEIKENISIANYALQSDDLDYYRATFEENENFKKEMLDDNIIHDLFIHAPKDVMSQNIRTLQKHFDFLNKFTIDEFKAYIEETVKETDIKISLKAIIEKLEPNVIITPLHLAIIIKDEKLIMICLDKQKLSGSEYQKQDSLGIDLQKALNFYPAILNPSQYTHTKFFTTPTSPPSKEIKKEHKIENKPQSG